jgi:hypothetical protein
MQQKSRTSKHYNHSNTTVRAHGHVPPYKSFHFSETIMSWSQLLCHYKYTTTNTSSKTQTITELKSGQLAFQKVRQGLLSYKSVLYLATDNTVTNVAIFSFDDVKVTAKHATSKDRMHFVPIGKGMPYRVTYRGWELDWYVQKESRLIQCFVRESREELCRLQGEGEGWADGTIMVDLGVLADDEMGVLEVRKEWEAFLVLTLLSMPNVLKLSKGMGVSEFQ